MYHEPYGPRGAEDERKDFWTDIAEGADALPGELPPAERMTELANLAGFDVQEPYAPTPAPDVADLPRPIADKLETENPDASHNDPLGSWTGVPEELGEIPTQDQDDL